MKYLVICMLVLAGVLIAGCTTTQAPPPTLPPTTVVVTTVLPTATTTSQPSFTMGDHYLQKSYSLQSENEVYYEEFRVDNPSWGIAFDVLPLNENLQYCWFELNVTNMDTGHTDTFGYGRSYSYEKYQQYPMYSTGPYKFEIKGNRVKVDLTAAKRNP